MGPRADPLADLRERDISAYPDCDFRWNQVGLFEGSGRYIVSFCGPDYRPILGAEALYLKPTLMLGTHVDEIYICRLQRWWSATVARRRLFPSVPPRKEVPLHSAAFRRARGFPPRWPRRSPKSLTIGPQFPGPLLLKGIVSLAK